ncbi:hypothetical protein K445DRAFT_256410 [Daldinia sp. EC12]|nr:hypothetical protein K445DRAFT_256410 [Daldinia sp. EC12]
MTAVQPFVFACWRSMRYGHSWSREFKSCDIGPIAGPAFACIFAAFFCFTAYYVVIVLSGDVNREAPLVADLTCNAVHVGLSTWRYYLDVDEYARALRIITSWFNA